MSCDITKHPCFNAEARGRFGRVHLPVAPECNIQCKFCDRKYDCVSESRPGVTSAVLTPEQAVTYLEKVLARDPRIAVAGLAGPGDPFANPVRTLDTLRLVRERFPDLVLCVSSNGLNVTPYVDVLAELGVSHLTITINAVDPAVAEPIYAWVRKGCRVYRGREAMAMLQANQLAAVGAAKAAGLTVKINTIVIAGVNDGHVGEVARTVASLGADVQNCIPLLPVASTVFEAMVPPPAEAMARIRAEAALHLPQMEHCTRCRADAVGLLGEPVTMVSVACLRSCSQPPAPAEESRPYVAVASMEGVLVNQHLGQADSLWVFGRSDGAPALVERRPAPRPGGGAERWVAMADTLKDCCALLVNGAGRAPTAALTERGIRVVVMEGIIEDALRAVYSGAEIRAPARRAACGCASATGDCTGNGTGCS